METATTRAAAPERRTLPGAFRGRWTVPGGFELDRSGVVRPCAVAWELVGSGDAPVVAVLGGISAHRHVRSHRDDARQGWWEDFVGPGRALDTDRVRVLSIDWLGGPGDSSTPGGVNGMAPDAPEGDLPSLTTRDQAAALAAVHAGLGLPPLRVVVGASYGGMVALAFAADHPGRVERTLVLGAAHEPHPMATALRAIQRRIVGLGRRGGREREGMALARALAMTTYRSAAEFAERFPVRPESDGPRGERFPVESYLDHHGETFARRFDPRSFLLLSRSIDLHRVDPGRIRGPVTLVAFRGDAIAPPWQLRELRDALPGEAELVEIATPRGHDAFLTDVEPVSEVVRRVVDGRDGRAEGNR